MWTLTSNQSELSPHLNSSIWLVFQASSQLAWVAFTVWLVDANPRSETGEASRADYVTINSPENFEFFKMISQRFAREFKLCINVDVNAWSSNLINVRVIPRRISLHNVTKGEKIIIKIVTFVMDSTAYPPRPCPGVPSWGDLNLGPSSSLRCCCRRGQCSTLSSWRKGLHCEGSRRPVVATAASVQAGGRGRGPESAKAAVWPHRISISSVRVSVSRLSALCDEHQRRLRFWRLIPHGFLWNSGLLLVAWSKRLDWNTTRPLLPESAGLLFEEW